MEKDHEEARRIAEESMVLLQNTDQILPLKASEKVAFIGGFAKKPRFQGGGSSHINCFKITNALESVPADAQVTYAEGFPADKDLYDEKLAAEAVQAAKTADKVVIFAGLPDSFESEGYDRSHMRLPECQNRLIGEILEVQPNTVVVLHNGSPVEMPWINDVKGILEAYLGGQAGGAAVANILYGIVNPSGKLAETIPVKLADNPSYLNFGGGDKVEYREGVFVGYRYYDTKQMEVAYPFGYGLSYTTFTYSNLQISNTNPTEKDTITVSVDVTNTGKVAGKEVVQLYVKDMTASAIRPEKELKGFEKVQLAPDETKTVTMELESNLGGNPLISFASATTLIAGATGSGSGGIGIAMEVFAQKYMDLGVNPEVLHRIAAIACNGLDTLPHNSMVITCLAACGMTHKESYKPIFITSVCITLIGLAFAVFLGIAFY